MKILTRYVLRQHLGPLVFSLSTLTAVLLLNQVAKQFGNLVGKGLPWTVIAEFFLLTIPFIIAMTLPMAVLIAVLYTFSHLAADNEISALKASGVGILRIVQPVLWGGVVMALIMLAFNDQLLPRSNHRLSTLQTDIARKKPTFALREQVINELSPGKLFLRAGRVDGATNHLKEVTIYDLGDPLRRRTIYADSGTMEMTADRRDLQMTLFHGYTQEIPRDNPGELQRLFYTVDLIRVRGVGNQLERTEENTYKGDREMSICEMQKAYEESALELRVARTELANALGAAARKAATGRASAKMPPAAKPRVRGIGSAYCRLTAKLTEVRSASAAIKDSLVSGSSVEGSLRPALNDAPAAAFLMASAQDSASAPAIPQLVLPQSAQPVAAPARPKAEESVAVTLAQLDMIRARMIDARSRASQMDTEIQKKFALAAACVVFVLLGAPIALRFPRGGVGLVLGVSFTVFALYYVGLIAGESLANKLILSPVWAMWLANFIFTGIGLIFMFRSRKGSSTARGGDVRDLLDSLRSGIARQARRVGIPMDRRRRTT